MDDDNDKAISVQEFTKAMKDFKVDLTEKEVSAIFNEIDMNNDGTLSIDEIVRAIQVLKIKQKLIFIIVLKGRNEQF